MNCNGCIHLQVCKYKESYEAKEKAIKELIGVDDLQVNCKKFELPKIVTPIMPVTYPQPYNPPFVYWDDKTTGKKHPYTWEITCHG